MRRTRRLSLAVLCALPVALGPAAAAHANDFDKVYAAFQKSGGAINACKFTPAQLKYAAAHVPNDFAQYAPEFKDAIDAAAAQRATGACDTKSGATSRSTAATSPTGGGTAPPTSGTPRPSTAAPASTPAAAQPTASVPTPQPAPSVRPAAAASDGAILAAARNTDSSGGAPAPLVALGILALLAALAGLAVGAVRWFAFEPRWLVRSRHATAEAGWRTSAAWAEFADWLRLGR